jgi:hypothetical protein
VRGIDSITRDAAEGMERYEVRVEATPQPDNIAHADIYLHRAAPTKSAQKAVFRMLKEELVRLAQWEPGFGPSDGEVPPPTIP